MLYFEGAWRGKAAGERGEKKLSTSLRAHGDDE